MVDPLQPTVMESLMAYLSHLFVTVRKKKVHFMNFDSASYLNVKMKPVTTLRMRTE